MEREALTLALDVLIEMSLSGSTGSDIWQKQMSAITTIAKALAQPAQEPVARVSGVYGGRFTYDPINRAMILPVGMALYSAPKGNT